MKIPKQKECEHYFVCKYRDDAMCPLECGHFVQRDEFKPYTTCISNYHDPEPYCCPVCNGVGLVSRPIGMAGDVQVWSSAGTGSYTCRACGGTGVVWG